MARIVIFITFILASVCSKADNQVLLSELDNAISMRKQYDERKEKRIEFLKAEINKSAAAELRLKLYDAIYQEYYVFKLDSALKYANEGYQLAQKSNNQIYKDIFAMNRALSLSIGGLYTEALETMNSINTEHFNKQMNFKYYSILYVLYQYKVGFVGNLHYKSIYLGKAKEYLTKTLQYLSPKDSLYDNYMSEKYFVIDKDLSKSKNYNLSVIRKFKDTYREYAQSCFSLASIYLQNGDEEKYEEYLIRSAISDIKNSNKETPALQTLAFYLYEQGDKEIERAEKYINCSMDDAMFFNNRLRILENSRIMPKIMCTYQNKVKKQNLNLWFFGAFCLLLITGLMFTTYYIYKQNTKLDAKKKELADEKEKLQDLNKQLHMLNGQLVDTNKKREGLASIYIDLCAKYIDKLVKYQTLVKRKIKANQAAELLTMISSTHISEEDAAIFLTRFDRAFMELYPSFVDEFNSLLSEEARIKLKTPYTLSTELRTFALIRLGVKNTTDIARLLFLSNQTIYNCRSVVKSKAINKLTFEEDVMKIM